MAEAGYPCCRLSPVCWNKLGGIVAANVPCQPIPAPCGPLRTCTGYMRCHIDVGCHSLSAVQHLLPSGIRTPILYRRRLLRRFSRQSRLPLRHRRPYRLRRYEPPTHSLLFPPWSRQFVRTRNVGTPRRRNGTDQMWRPCQAVPFCSAPSGCWRTRQVSGVLPIQA